MALKITTVIIIGCILYGALGLKTSKEICTTPACLEAAMQLRAYVNPDVDPCDNFFQFVCTKLKGEIPTNLKYEYEQQLRKKAEIELAALMREPIADNDPAVIRDQKELYQACMEQTGVERSKEILQDGLLNELGGWPVVENFRWKEEPFDWVKTMQTLKNKGYPFGMLLDVGVAFSINEPEGNVFTINPPYMEKMSKEHRNSYLNYMIEVAHIFGAEKHRAETDMGEVLEFMEKLYNIYDEHFERFSSNTRGISVRHLQNKYNEIQWLNLINSLLYPVANVTNDTLIDFPIDKYMKSFFNLMKKTSKRIQANYMIWKTLNEVIPYMSEDLKSLKENHERQINPKKNRRERSDFCKDIMSDKPFRILYARKHLPKEKWQQVKEFFFSIKSEFTKSLTETSWMDHESELRAVEKINTTTDIIGSPRDYFSDAIFEEFNTVYQVNDNSCKNNFFCLHLNARKRQLRILLNFHDTSVNGIIFHGWSTNPTAYYLSNVNIIVLPAGFFQDEFYSNTRPMYLNYGSSGAIIASTLAGGFCQNKLNIWSSGTKEKLIRYKKCVQGKMDEIDVRDTSGPFLTVDQSIMDHSGIKTAYKAYQNWVKSNGKELKLPGVRFTPDQLFWISAMSLKCFSPNNDQENSTYRILQANAPFRNNIDFSNDFQCALNSKMDPSDKCVIL